LIGIAGRYAVVLVITDLDATSPPEGISVVLGGGKTPIDAIENALKFSDALRRSVWRTREAQGL
jgi:hypothetical protein